MKKKLNEKIKEQKGAATLLVFITVMSFAAILTGTLIAILVLRQSQLKSDIKIKEIYESDVYRVNEIYDELIEKNNSKVDCNISYKILNNKLQYTYLFERNVKNFEQEDITLYKGENISNSIGSNATLSISNPMYSTQLNVNGTYLIRFDYKCINQTQQFELGLYSDTNLNLPKKNIIATSTLKHEDWIVTLEDSMAYFKLLATIQNSNNVTISNFEIIKLNTNEPVTNQNFTKEDDNEYTLLCDYSESLRYVMIIENRVCEDFKDVPNVRKMVII